MLHVAAVLAAAMVLIAVVDVAQGRVPLLGESTHLPEILSVWFLWILARPKPDTIRSSSPNSPTEEQSVGLRVVGPGEEPHLDK